MFYGLSCAARFGVNIVNILFRIDCLLSAVYYVSSGARLQCHDTTLDTTVQNRVSGVIQRGIAVVVRSNPRDWFANAD